VDGLNIAARRASRTGVLPLPITWKLGLEEEGLTDDIRAALIGLLKDAPISRWASFTLRDTSGFLDEMIEAEFSYLIALNVIADPAAENFDIRILQFIDRTAVSIVELLMTDNWGAVEALMPDTFKRVKRITVIDHFISMELSENVIELITLQLPSNIGQMQHLTHLIIDRLEVSWSLDVDTLLVEYLDVGGSILEDGGLGVTITCANLLQLKIPGNAPFLLSNIVAPKLKNLRIQEVWD
jgi:hypothetical protein